MVTITEHFPRARHHSWGFQGFIYTHPLPETETGIINPILVAQIVKNPPAMGETWVRSLGWEDPLKRDMTTHSSIPAWRIPMVRGAWWAAVHGVAKSQTRLSD